MDLIDLGLSAYYQEVDRKRIALNDWKVRHLAEIKCTVARYFDVTESDVFSGDEQFVEGSTDEYAIRVGDLEFSLPEANLIVYYRCPRDGLVRDYFVARHAESISNREALGRMFVRHTCPCRKKKEDAA